MKKLYLVAQLFVSVFITMAQSNVQIEITNLRNDKGKIMLELLDENEKSLKSVIGIIKNGSCVLTMNDLANGNYAVKYFHDENANGDLDTNWIGIPTEGYGFSNDAYGKYGPKDFEEWLFKVPYGTKLVLKTAYL